MTASTCSVYASCDGQFCASDLAEIHSSWLYSYIDFKALGELEYKLFSYVFHTKLYSLPIYRNVLSSPYSGHDSG